MLYTNGILMEVEIVAVENLQSPKPSTKQEPASLKTQCLRVGWWVGHWLYEWVGQQLEQEPQVEPATSSLGIWAMFCFQ
jgi:hypothetical protein